MFISFPYPKQNTHGETQIFVNLCFAPLYNKQSPFKILCLRFEVATILSWIVTKMVEGFEAGLTLTLTLTHNVRIFFQFKTVPFQFTLRELKARQ